MAAPGARSASEGEDAVPRPGAAVAPSSTGFRVVPVESGRQLDAFLDLPRSVYAGDPCWVEPLRSEVRETLSDVNPFWRRAERRLFVAFRGDRPVGRVAAIENRAHNEFHSDRVGFFGFFECLDDPEAARVLLDAAGAWLKARGLDSARGPVSPSMGEECGVVVDGLGRPPVILTAYNPPYYAALLESCGLRKAKDLYAWWLGSDAPVAERVERIIERVRRRTGVKVRTLDPRRFEEELKLVQEIYNEAWERNWGFVPMTEEEVVYTAGKLKPILDPRFVLFAEVEGKAVAMAVSLPDVNQALKGLGGRLGPINIARFLWRQRRIDQVRVFALGLRRAWQRTGIDALLYYETRAAARRYGKKGGELSWTLEDNEPINGGIRAMGAEVYKTFRIFEKPL